jgi:hypothetical protein
MGYLGSGLRLIAALGIPLCALGCASSTELRARSEHHLQRAQLERATGDLAAAAHDERRAQYLFERAGVRAYEEERPVPPPPPSAHNFPLF